jgi:pyrimidine-specific ribonucleoside hydrolase
MKKVIGFLLLFGFLCGPLDAHSGKPKFQVIIDTDGAIDDMRAISMFLAGNDIRVLALTCSQGTLLPDSVYVKVRSLLTGFHHEGIPVGIGDRVQAELPSWSSFAQKIKWGPASDCLDEFPHLTSQEILDRCTESCKEKITLVALGSLKTYADWIRHNPLESEKIERILWYNSHEINEGYNYNIDPESYELIRQSGIPLELISASGDTYSIDNNYLHLIQVQASIYAKQIASVHSQAIKHLILWDDLVPLYLCAPILFERVTENNISFVTMQQKLPPELVYETIGDLLVSASSPNNRVFLDFPVDPALYKPAYAAMMKKTISQYGHIEWKAITMTNEIHGHTGIYSIIGAKMGIRAMDYFNVGINNLMVNTFAGNKPPISCFNDGIQISTGATIGQGLISVSDSVSSIPSATFEFNNQKVHISVKPEIAEKMQDEIKYGVENYGLLSDRYWLYIEDLAMDYWANFDRNDIFVIETQEALEN